MLIGLAGVEGLAYAFDGFKFKRLDLDYNQIGDAGAEANYAGAGGARRFLAGVRDGRFLFASRAAAGSRCQGVYPLFLRADRRESARRWAGPILLVRSRLVVVRERAAYGKYYDPYVETSQHACLGSRHGGK